MVVSCIDRGHERRRISEAPLKADFPCQQLVELFLAAEQYLLRLYFFLNIRYNDHLKRASTYAVVSLDSSLFRSDILLNV